MGENLHKARMSDRIIDLLMIVVLILMIVILIFLFNRFYPQSPPTEAPTPTPTDTPVSLPNEAPVPNTISDIFPPLRIAYVVRSLGIQKGIGEAQIEGFKTAEDYFSDQGFDIKFFPKESGNITKTIQHFEELNRDDDVLVIIGPTLSTEAEQAVPTVDTSDISIIGISNTKQKLIDDFVAQGIKNYVRISSPVQEFAEHTLSEAFAQHVEDTQTQLENVVIAYASDDSFTTSEAAAYRKTLDGASFPHTDVISITFTTEDTNFSRQITSVLTPTISESPLPFSNGGPAELFIVSGLTNDGGSFVKQLREQGYTGLIIGGNGLNVPGIEKFCAPYCDRMIVAQTYDYNNSHAEENEEFKRIYRTRNSLPDDENPTQFTAQAFAAIQVVIHALRIVDSQEKGKQRIRDMELDDLQIKLNEVLHSGIEINTVLGSIKIDSKGEVEQSDIVASLFINGNHVIKK